ncbi:MAG: precorrin-6A synthase (deacetylating) [Alphaproteobacteria bacterium]|nr:precorrin-6A synthase (deacetylating) [Alphaproteobacteria bacterium]
MKKILLIGIGAGNPDHVTMQAVEALNRADVIFVMEKGAAKERLTALRREICRRHLRRPDTRIVEASSPERDTAPADYRACVEDRNKAKQSVFERLIAEEVAEGQCGAFLLWGDPALYDSTLRNVEAIAATGRQTLEIEIIPGIMAPQVLAARHRIPLNRIAQSVHITTGRKLREGWPEEADSVVVMLDGEDSFGGYAETGEDIDIFWGAYLGMEEEILIAGKLADVADEISRVRARARAANGWIMDTYLMRRN